MSFIFKCYDIITQDNILNNDFENMHVSDEIQNLSLLFNMSIRAMIPTNKDFFNDGEHEKTIN
jgi:hypothetical protein